MSKDNYGQLARLAYGMPKADGYHIRLRTCCSCNLTASRSLNGMCFGCAHRLCEICSETGFVSEGHDLSLHETTHEAQSALPKPSAPILPLLAIVSNSNQTQEFSLADFARVHPHPSEVNKEQEHEMRPHGESLEEHQSLPIPGPHKRKLNMVKCERCRIDKKACVRQGSEKCHRCEEKGHICSDGTRAKRPRKLASRLSSSVHANISSSIDSSTLGVQLQELIFFKSYCKMMTMALERLEQLEKDVESYFGEIGFPVSDRGPSSLRSFVEDDLKDALWRFAELSETENASIDLPARSLSVSEILASFSISPDVVCPKCSFRPLKATINRLRHSLDTCGEFMLQQHLLEQHEDSLHLEWSEEPEHYQIKKKERSVLCATEIPRKVEAILEPYELHNSAVNIKSIGLYHSDLRNWNNNDWQSKYLDCLGRTPLHRFLDGHSKHISDGFLVHFALSDKSFVNMNWWNSQDIIGRTPLHIICQFRYLGSLAIHLKSVLEAGANPGLETIYGSLPLHYAAVNGVFVICELLMKHKSKFDIGAEDKNGRTALDYAVIKKHQPVVDFLRHHYEKAGLNHKVKKARRIGDAVTTGVHFF